MPKVQQAQADLGIIRTPELARVTVKESFGSPVETQGVFYQSCGNVSICHTHQFLDLLNGS